MMHIMGNNGLLEAASGTMMAARASQHHFMRMHPSGFVGDHSLQMPGHSAMLPQDQIEAQAMREQVEVQTREIQRLQATITHYRNWAAQLQSRYQMFSPDAARPAKRVYIGNLAPDVTEADLRQGINELMIQSGATCAPGFPITSCKLYPGAQRTVLVSANHSSSAGVSDTEESPVTDGTASDLGHSGSVKGMVLPPELARHPGAMMHPSTSAGMMHSGQMPHLQQQPQQQQQQSGANPMVLPMVVQDKSYAFVEFRSVEEASNCMALDGVRFRDNFLKIRRPNNYDPGVAIMLGPTDPNPAMDLTGFDVVRTVVQDSPHKVFLGGLPCDWTEDQVKEMLVPYGHLKAFNLVMDRATGNSKGYAFCEFADITVTDNVIQSLNGKPVGNKYLTVKRALGPAGF